MRAPIGIVNPAAGGGRVGRTWDHLRPALEAHLGPVDWRLTGGPGGASTLARGVAGATDVVYVVGGDGTISEVVDGLVAGGAPLETALGVLPAGTGGDLRRSLGLPPDPVAAAERLVDAEAAALDVVRLDFVGADGAPALRHFINVLSAGINGHVDRAVNASSKRWGGTVTFLSATVATWFRYRPVTIAIEVDDAPVGRFPATTLFVCNGRWAGGGMRLAPEARLDDGLLDLVLVEPRGLWASLAVLPRLYRGTLAGGHRIHTWRGARVSLTIEGDGLLDVDGETPGSAPAALRVLPGRLRMLRPRGDAAAG